MSAWKRSERFSRAIKIDSHRGILREVWQDAVAIKIEVINHHLAVFRGILLGCQIRLKRQSGVVVGAQGDPQTRPDSGHGRARYSAGPASPENGRWSG